MLYASCQYYDFHYCVCVCVCLVFTIQLIRNFLSSLLFCIGSKEIRFFFVARVFNKDVTHDGTYKFAMFKARTLHAQITDLT